MLGFLHELNRHIKAKLLNTCRLLEKLLLWLVCICISECDVSLNLRVASTGKYTVRLLMNDCTEVEDSSNNRCGRQFIAIKRSRVSNWSKYAEIFWIPCIKLDILPVGSLTYPILPLLLTWLCFGCPSSSFIFQYPTTFQKNATIRSID